MILVGEKPKTKIYKVLSKHEDILGEVKWYAPWRQYSFFPEDECIFSKGCMNDINDFMTELMEARKTK